MNKRKVGSEWEDRAAAYLKKRRVVILERNYRCRTGEIDIIGREGDTYIFVEVKYRRNSSYGLSYEAVTPKKQQTIKYVSQFYLLSHGIPLDVKIRFDVCGIDGTEMTYIKGAF
jgi:putative endonuclease